MEPPLLWSLRVSVSAPRMATHCSEICTRGASGAMWPSDLKEVKLNPYAKKLFLSQLAWLPQPPLQGFILSHSRKGWSFICASVLKHISIAPYSLAPSPWAHCKQSLNRKTAGKVGSVLPPPRGDIQGLVRADKKWPIPWGFKALRLKPSSKRKQSYNPLATERQEPLLSSPCTHLAPILPRNILNMFCFPNSRN